MVLHPLVRRTSPVRLRKPHLPAALSTTRTVVHRLKPSSTTQNVLTQEWQTRLHGHYSDPSIEWSPGKERMVRWYGWCHTADGPVPSAPILEHFNVVLQEGAAVPLPDHLKRDSFGRVQLGFYKFDGGVSPHCDHEAYNDPVIIASTLSTTSMQFENGGSTFELLLKPGSLLVLTGDSRTKFSHGMETRQHDDTPAGAQPRETASSSHSAKARNPLCRLHDLSQ